jgi:hypothetical protein
MSTLKNKNRISEIINTFFGVEFGEKGIRYLSELISEVCFAKILIQKDTIKINCEFGTFHLTTFRNKIEEQFFVPKISFIMENGNGNNK